MTPEIEDFERALDRLGGDLAIWPAAERAEAEALLAGSAAARQALRAMELVEHLLARSGLVREPAPDDLVARATVQPQERATRRWRAAVPRAWRMQAAAAGLLLAGGFAFGAALPGTPPAEEAPSFALGPLDAFDAL